MKVAYKQGCINSSQYFFFQDPRTYAEIEVKGNGSLEWRTVTICSGLDLVNITYTPLIAADVDTSRVGISKSKFEF